MDLLKNLFDFNKELVDVVETFGGCEYLEALQYHPLREVYEEASGLVENYY